MLTRTQYILKICVVVYYTRWYWLRIVLKSILPVTLYLSWWVHLHVTDTIKPNKNKKCIQIENSCITKMICFHGIVNISYSVSIFVKAPPYKKGNVYYFTFVFLFGLHVTCSVCFTQERYTVIPLNRYMYTLRERT